jgi:hypothetical protein
MILYLKRQILLFISISFIISCSNLNNPEKEDNVYISPTVSITEPFDSALVPKLVEITCTVSDTSEMIKYLELLIDNHPSGIIDSTEPYSFLWSTIAYDNNSEHTISFKSYNKDSTHVISDEIVVTVNNADSIYSFKPYYECIESKNSMNNKIQIYSSAFPDLEIQFGTSKEEYNIEDSCIPISLVLTNRGSEIINLNEEEAVEILNSTIGIYNNSRLFEINLSHTEGATIQAGPFLQPDEYCILSATVNKNRIVMYFPPPLGGGSFQRSLNFQGPWGILGFGRLDIIINIDYGRLHDFRTYESGAGSLFVPGQLVVGYQDSITLENAEKFVYDNDCYISGDFSELVFLVITIPFNRSTGEMIEILGVSPLVTTIGRNFYGHRL